MNELFSLSVNTIEFRCFYEFNENGVISFTLFDGFWLLFVRLSVFFRFLPLINRLLLMYFLIVLFVNHWL